MKTSSLLSLLGLVRLVFVIFAAVIRASVSFTAQVPLSTSITTHFARLSPLHPVSTVPALSAANENDGDNPTSTFTSTYKTSDSSSKGIVSLLTGAVNCFMRESSNNNGQDETLVELPPPPTSPNELMNKIRDDYVVNNYLWTGGIYLSAFEEDCRFTDPTLSFTGRDKFVSNVQKLRPIVDFLIEENGCESKLLDISLNEKEGYVQSRWNMIGNLTRLPWSPRIDVIGRTKFWYNKGDTRSSSDDSSYRVFFYDEEWEMPASRALLQLVTRPGMISNGSD